MVMEHVGVELPPGDLRDEGGGSGSPSGCGGDRRARMDGPEAQVRAEPARAGLSEQVAIVAVAVDRAIDEGIEQGDRRRLTRRREMGRRRVWQVTEQRGATDPRPGHEVSDGRRRRDGGE